MRKRCSTLCGSLGNRRRRTTRPLAVALLLGAVAGGAPGLAQNGIGGSPAAGPAHRGPITVGDPLWIVFSFTSVATPAAGCAPADPGGLSCLIGPNTQAGDAPPWTFTASGPVVLTVVDGFANGDQFEVFDFGASLGLTSAVAAAGSCGGDPVVCLGDPNTSSGTFNLGAGDHSITIVPTVSPFGTGAAFFRVDPVMPSMPATALALLAVLLLGGGAFLYQRRSGSA